MFGRGRGYPRAPLPKNESLLLGCIGGMLDNSWFGGKVYNHAVIKEQNREAIIAGTVLRKRLGLGLGLGLG